jgi:TolB-like protein/class 3 adenylate cyclase
VVESRKLAAILAADVVGFSRLIGADEEGTLARLRAVRSDLMDPAVSLHQGRVVKRTGDGAIVEFRSVVDAVRCAIVLQTGMAERNAGVPAETRIDFRIGVHLGDVVEESDGDLMGDGVNIAARLEGVAAPGAICLSEDAYRQVRARLDLAASDLGETRLKNIAEPIRVYSVSVAGSGAAEAPRGDRASPDKPAARPDSAAKPSIAVLAFQNMSGDKEQEYFSDGISEDIITDLSKLSELHVIARNSSFTYKDKAVSIPAVARDLGVRYVLEGSVRKAGNRIRVTAQLIDSLNGGHVWANRFDRELTDIFDIQDELTREIVAALKLKLTRGERDRLVRRRAASVEAYELLLRSREQAMLLTRAGNMAARQLADAAIAIDPEFAAAYALSAFTLFNDYANGYGDDPAGALRLGRELAERAVRMDGEDPAARLALGSAYSWSRDLSKAEAEARRGLALSPNSTELMILLVAVQIYAGDPAAAIGTLDALMELDPHYPDIALQFLADARFSLGDYRLAVDALERRLKRNLESESAFALLASCYGWLGRPEEARKAWDEVMRIKPDYSIERRRQVQPFRRAEDFEQRVEGLRRAGLKI